MHFRDSISTTHAVDMDKRIIRGMVSTPDIDADRTIINPLGISLERYQKNPIVLRDHKNELDAQMGIAQKLTPSADGIHAELYLTPKPEGYEGNWMQDVVLYLYSAKHLRAFSIGFEELESRRPTPEEKEEHPGLQGVFEKWELCEISLVCVPSNPSTVSDKFLKYIEKGNPMELEVIKKELKPRSRVTLVEMVPQKEIIKKMISDKVHTHRHRGRILYE